MNSSSSSTSIDLQLHNSPKYAASIVLIAQIALLLLALRTSYKIFFSPLNHIPGPVLARFSNLWRFLSVSTGHAEQTQRQLHDQLGPAVRLGPNMVSISDPAMIPEIYARQNVLLKSDYYSVNDLVVDGRRVPNVFSTRDEQHNTKVMKPIIKLFSMGHVLSMEALLDSTVRFFMQRLDEEFASTGRECDMASWLHYCAWDIVGKITFGQRMGFLERGLDVHGLCRMGHAAMNYFSRVGMMPWLDLLLDKNPIRRFGPPVFLPAVEFSLKRIADRRSGTNGRYESRTPDFLDGFLAAQQRYPDVVTDDTVLSYLMANVAAGSDTVATELRSILYHLCRSPPALARLQAELDAAQVEVSLSWSKAKTLPYLCACVEEGIRLMPGISLPMERIVGPAGLTMPDAKTFIPPGTVVGINPWVVNRDRQVFGEAPHHFIPERWLPAADESDDAYQRRVSRMRSSELTFGFGKRQCAGRNLALLECHKIVGSLVRTFDIELAEPEKEWTTQNSWFMRQTDMNMLLRKRTQ